MESPSRFRYDMSSVGVVCYGSEGVHRFTPGNTCQIKDLYYGPYNTTLPYFLLY